MTTGIEGLASKRRQLKISLGVSTRRFFTPALLSARGTPSYHAPFPWLVPLPTPRSPIHIEGLHINHIIPITLNAGTHEIQGSSLHDRSQGDRTPHNALRRVFRGIGARQRPVRRPLPAPSYLRPPISHASSVRRPLGANHCLHHRCANGTAASTECELQRMCQQIKLLLRWTTRQSNQAVDRLYIRSRSGGRGVGGFGAGTERSLNGSPRLTSFHSVLLVWDASGCNQPHTSGEALVMAENTGHIMCTCFQRPGAFSIRNSSLLPLAACFLTLRV